MMGKRSTTLVWDSILLRDPEVLPSKFLKKREKINKVASSTYWISAHRCGDGAYDI